MGTVLPDKAFIIQYSHLYDSQSQAHMEPRWVASQLSKSDDADSLWRSHSLQQAHQGIWYTKKCWMLKILDEPLYLQDNKRTQDPGGTFIISSPHYKSYGNGDTFPQLPALPIN